MTLVAAGISWWNHRDYCLQQADTHAFLASVARDDAADKPIYANAGLSRRQQQAIATLRQRAVARAVHHGRLDAAYRRAIWRPWERLWIDEWTRSVVPG